MKILTYHIYAVLLFLTACQNSDSAAAPPIVDTPEAVAVTDGIQLTEAQQTMAGIEIGKVERRNLSTRIECSGQIEVPPYSLISIYTPMTGFVQTAEHLIGDYVKKGTLLTSLKHHDFIKLQREYLEAQSQLVFLESDYKRKETLQKEEAGAERLFEEAKANYESRLAHVNGLKAELQFIGINTEALIEKGNIQAQIHIYAPASGYIAEVNINRGKLVTPTDKLFEIVDNKHLHLELNVFAKDLPKVKKGQRIEAYIPGTTQKIEAEVHLIGKTVDMEKRTALIHGHMVGDQADVAVGIFLNATIHIDEKNVPAVPITALVQEGGKYFIFLKKADSFEKMEVEIGASNDNYAELLHWDLAEETEIVTKGAYYIQETE